MGSHGQAWALKVPSLPSVAGVLRVKSRIESAIIFRYGSEVQYWTDPERLRQLASPGGRYFVVNSAHILPIEIHSQMNFRGH